MDSALGVIGPGSSTAVKLDLLQRNSVRMLHLWTSTLFVRLAQALAALWVFWNLILVSRNSGGFKLMQLYELRERLVDVPRIHSSQAGLTPEGKSTIICLSIGDGGLILERSHFADAQDSQDIFLCRSHASILRPGFSCQMRQSRICKQPFSHHSIQDSSLYCSQLFLLFQ